MKNKCGQFHKINSSDRDECEEKSDYCDSFATCNNTDGGFECHCPVGYHLYNANSPDLSTWARIYDDLIDGYSCVGSFSFSNLECKNQIFVFSSVMCYASNFLYWL